MRRPHEAVTEGHRFAVVVIALMLCSGFLAVGAGLVARHMTVSRGFVRAVNAGLAALVVAAASIALVVAGGPSRGISELKERFDAEPVTGVDLNKRLFSVSSNGRSESIRVAWEAAEERPVVGHGAGSYEYLWYERRQTEGVIRDAHSLYAEVLSELGAVGLALLIAVLALPLVGAFVARRSRFVAAGAGAFLAWLAASALDWHWEMVGVTLSAFLLGGAALLASDRRRPTPFAGASRWVALGLSICLTAVSIVSLVGNQALFAARDDVARKNWASATDDGRRARGLLFWSQEPELVLGDAAAGLGDRAAALSRLSRCGAIRSGELGGVASPCPGRPRRRACDSLRDGTTPQSARGEPARRVILAVRIRDLVPDRRSSALELACSRTRISEFRPQAVKRT